MHNYYYYNILFVTYLDKVIFDLIHTDQLGLENRNKLVCTVLRSHAVEPDLLQQLETFIILIDWLIVYDINCNNI